MTYHEIIQLKNGASCSLRNGTAADGQAALDNFILTHAETDNLLTYPEETTLTAAQESEYLQTQTESANALALYKKFGFVEYGRIPKGFRSRSTGYQELVLMRLAL